MIVKYFQNRYESKMPYDEALPKIIGSIKKRITKNDDDFLLMFAGATGTGKSNLGLHALDLYTDNHSYIEFVALNQGDFANSLKMASEKEGLRYCMNDEANISKRDSLTKYNKRIIDLYYSIRGLNIFHIWCNPSIDMIDKTFIDEKINGLIYIATKDKTRPRIYYYFRKKELLKIWEKYQNLKLSTLKKCAKRYSFYIGWFKEYKGSLKEAYLKKKDDRMKEKIDDFYNDFGKKEGMTDRIELAKELGLHKDTIDKYKNILVESGELKDDEDIIRLLNGRVLLSDKAVDKIKEKIELKSKSQKSSKETSISGVSLGAVSNYTHEGMGNG